MLIVVHSHGWLEDHRRYLNFFLECLLHVGKGKVDVLNFCVPLRSDH
jgi:hypothetical protein